MVYTTENSASCVTGLRYATEEKECALPDLRSSVRNCREKGGGHEKLNGFIMYKCLASITYRMHCILCLLYRLVSILGEVSWPVATLCSLIYALVYTGLFYAWFCPLGREIYGYLRSDFARTRRLSFVVISRYPLPRYPLPR